MAKFIIVNEKPLADGRVPQYLNADSVRYFYIKQRGEKYSVDANAECGDFTIAEFFPSYEDAQRYLYNLVLSVNNGELYEND